jgi:hypothetical protein
MIRAVANQKLDMTNDEYRLYEQIVSSYDSSDCDGDFLFHDLFVSDDSGMITCLIPPSVRNVPLQVFLFLISLMVQQQLRMARLETKHFIHQDIGGLIKRELKEILDRPDISDMISKEVRTTLTSEIRKIVNQQLEEKCQK